MNESISFPRRLYDLRKSAGLTQQQLADQLYVTRRIVNDWEHGRKLPSFDSIIALAQVFDVTTDYIILGGKQK